MTCVMSSLMSARADRFPCFDLAGSCARSDWTPCLRVHVRLLVGERVGSRIDCAFTTTRVSSTPVMVPVAATPEALRAGFARILSMTRHIEGDRRR